MPGSPIKPSSDLQPSRAALAFHDATHGPALPPYDEELPLNANPKQHHRILKRRAARQRLAEQQRLAQQLHSQSGGRRQYNLESILSLGQAGLFGWSNSNVDSKEVIGIKSWQQALGPSVSFDTMNPRFSHNDKTSKKNIGDDGGNDRDKNGSAEELVTPASEATQIASDEAGRDLKVSQNAIDTVSIRSSPTVAMAHEMMLSTLDNETRMARDESEHDSAEPSPDPWPIQKSFPGSNMAMLVGYKLTRATIYSWANEATTEASHSLSVPSATLNDPTSSSTDDNNVEASGGQSGNASDNTHTSETGSRTISDSGRGSGSSRVYRKHPRKIQDGNDGSDGSSGDRDRPKRYRATGKTTKVSLNKPRFLCIYEAYHREQPDALGVPGLHCHRGSEEETERGFSTFKSVRAHIQRYHSPSQRCNNCWKTFRRGGELTVHLEQHGCAPRQSPPYMMSSPTEQKFTQKRFSGPNEDRWWDLFRLLIPQSDTCGLDILKNMYSPYIKPYQNRPEKNQVSQLTVFMGQATQSAPGAPESRDNFTQFDVTLDFYHPIYSMNTDLSSHSEGLLPITSDVFEIPTNLLSGGNMAGPVTQDTCPVYHLSKNGATAGSIISEATSKSTLNNKRLKARIIQLETQLSNRTSLDRKLMKDMMLDVGEVQKILEGIIDDPDNLTSETFEKVLKASEIATKLKDQFSRRLEYGKMEMETNVEGAV
ncbi:putative C2H2-type domain-containing protein [Seiridium unicorne]|uniref:C2H2-type domain-containing protein n=1 Tax=Seiridium unicorne TaxID=138068 RepID=A0ABR2VC11_9PEZI